MAGANINWGLLRELAGFRAENGCAVSFCLNLAPRLSPTAADIQTRTRALVDEAQKRAESSRGQRTHDQQASIRTDLARIQRYVEGEFSRDGTHGLVIFAAGLDNFWRPLALSAPVPDVVKVSNEFYLTPLVPLVGRGGGALVAYVGRERGDLYELNDGRLQGIVDRFEEQPRRHDQGGWSQANFQRHVDNLAHSHLRVVAAELERELRQRRSAQVVIACSEETRSEFAGLLSSEARRAIVGWTHAEAHVTGQGLLKLVKPVLDRGCAEREAKDVERWHD